MANLTSYKRVSGDVSEAKLIRDLLQKNLTDNLGELAKDIPALTKATAIVGKWNDIVTDLENPDEPAPNPAKVVHDAMKDALAGTAPEGGDAKPQQKRPNTPKP